MVLAPPPPVSKLPVIDPPSLCEAGPCRNYHRIVSVMDAERPMDGSDSPARTQITRACYPLSGIEVELGEFPILQCSHWDPRPDDRRDLGRTQYLASPNGVDFAANVASYEQAVGLVDGDDNNEIEGNDR